MLLNKQAEEAIVPGEIKGANEQEQQQGEQEAGVERSMSGFKNFFWHGGSAYDAWFSYASNQVAQVLLTLPYSFSQLGMLSGIILQVFYGLLGSWTAYLIGVLYVEYRAREEKENVFSMWSIEQERRKRMSASRIM
ncbi:putative amino acid transporter, transmembrane domain-containing protein [Helianthus anomalus]